MNEAFGALSAICSDRPNPLQFADRVSLSPRFAQWISILVEPDVSDRFLSAREALAALQLPPAQSVRFVKPSRSQIIETGFFAAPASSSITVKQGPEKLLITIPGMTRGKVFWFILLAIAIGFTGLYLIPLLIPLHLT